LQEIHKLQQSVGFDDGRKHTIASYMKASDEFALAWAEEYYATQQELQEQQQRMEAGVDYWSLTEKYYEGQDQAQEEQPAVPDQQIKSEGDPQAQVNTQQQTAEVQPTSEEQPPVQVQQLTEADIEREYWSIIESQTRLTTVEYGNDLGINLYQSGFSARPADLSDGNENYLLS